MDAVEGIVGLPFVVLRAPNLKLKVPSITLPSPMATFALVMVTYFLFTGGLIYGSIGACVRLIMDVKDLVLMIDFVGQTSSMSRRRWDRRWTPPAA